MKAKRFLGLTVVLSMTMSCMAGFSVNAETTTAVTELSESYNVTDPEAAVQAIDNNGLVLTNSESVNGNSVIGMTEIYVYDEIKGKNVRSIGFNKKAAGTNAAGAPNVRASLDGFAQYMTDENVNTISFDYKLSGTSIASVGMFMGSSVNDYGDHLDTGILIGNTKGVNIRTRINKNDAGSDWYTYAQNSWGSVVQANTNNREWNRVTVEVNKKTGEVKGYINGELISTVANSESNEKKPTDMNSFLFQTGGAVEKDGDLSILFDNIKVYPGNAKLADVSKLSSQLTLVNDTSIPTELGNMTDGYVMDPVRGTTVRRLVFNAKAADKNVRAGLTGFAKYMTDENVNTISFDYKLSGSSKNHVGLFLNDSVGGSYWVQDYGLVLLNNSQGIFSSGDRANDNSKDWYTVADYSPSHQAKPNNREWNRLTLEIYPKEGTKGVMKGYINGKLFKTSTLSDYAVALEGMDSIFFNTKPIVGTDTSGVNQGSLSILLDNVSVYPGEARAEDVDGLAVVNANGRAVKEFAKGDVLSVRAGVNNGGTEKASYIVILAAYNGDGACVDIKVNEIKDVKAGDRGYTDKDSCSLTVGDEVTTVKAYLWNTWDSLEPVCGFVSAALKTTQE